MAANNKNKSTLGERRTSSNVMFLIAVAVLIALLLIMYIHNRNRRAEFQKLQLEASGSEIVTELEPKTLEEEVTE